MRIRSAKLSLALIIPAVVMLSAPASQALPTFLTRAEKYGAKNCAFCHTRPSGGNAFNDRGKWLVAEKKRRNARQVNVDWLAEYKSAR